MASPITLPTLPTCFRPGVAVRRILVDSDLRKNHVVELRFFGGLSVVETAEALHVSADTVMRDWRLAKVWLVRELKRA